MIHSTSVPLRLRSGSFRAYAAIAFAAAVIAPTSVLGDVQVRGTPEAARVEAQGGSIDEVLAALGKAFDLRWQSPAPLDKRLTGTYEGSLNRVLARVLDGYNFVLKASQGRLEITVLGPRGARAVAAGAPGTASPAASTQPAAAKAPPPKPPAPPALASAVNKVAAGAPAAPAPTLTSATKVAEGPSVGPVPDHGAATVKPPEPLPSTVPPPMPGVGTGQVPELRPSAVLPPGGTAPPQPTDGQAAPSIGGTPPKP